MSDSTKAYLVVTVGRQTLEVDALTRALRRGRIACVLLQPEAGHAADRELLEPLVLAIQAADCAALITDDARLALAIGADGVHLHYEPDSDLAEKQFRAARAVLGDGRIVGAGCGLARHNAMVLAELGADYVALGHAAVDDPEARLEMVGWWAEMFAVPCVAWNVADAGAVGPLVMAGVDFVASGPDAGLALAIEILAALDLSRGGSR